MKCNLKFNKFSIFNLLSYNCEIYIQKFSTVNLFNSTFLDLNTLFEILNC